MQLNDCNPLKKLFIISKKTLTCYQHCRIVLRIPFSIKNASLIPKCSNSKYRKSFLLAQTKPHNNRLRTLYKRTCILSLFNLRTGS